MINAKLDLILNDSNNKDMAIEYQHESAIAVFLRSRGPGDSELQLIENMTPMGGKGLSLVGASKIVVNLSTLPRAVSDPYLFDTSVKSKVNGSIPKGVKVYSDLENYDGYVIGITSGRVMEGEPTPLEIYALNSSGSRTQYVPAVGRRVAKIIIEPCGCVQKYTDQDLRCQSPILLILDQFGCPFQLVNDTPVPPPTS